MVDGGQWGWWTWLNLQTVYQGGLEGVQIGGSILGNSFLDFLVGGT